MLHYAAVKSSTSYLGLPLLSLIYSHLNRFMFTKRANFGEMRKSYY